MSVEGQQHQLLDAEGPEYLDFLIQRRQQFFGLSGKKFLRMRVEGDDGRIAVSGDRVSGGQWLTVGAKQSGRLPDGQGGIYRNPEGVEDRLDDLLMSPMKTIEVPQGNSRRG
jgi:hypothetical protein